MSQSEYAGGCHCGAVRFLARGRPVNVRACHCGACRKVTGGAFFARAVFPIETVTRSGGTGRYRSSERLWRLFCPECGALVFVEPADRPGFLAVSLACLDEPSALSPEMHIFVADKPAWVTLADGVPQHPGAVPW